MSYPQFAKDVKVGERVMVDDGKLVFEVVSTDQESKVQLKALYAGTLKDNKGVNLPNTEISLPSLTKKDNEDLEYILANHPNVNWIALSFVRTAKEVKDLKERIAKAGHQAKVISKIEKPEAIKNIDKIIKASNAIMVARGDLGIELPMERLPIVQKMIVKKCIQRARPVIVATQMMDSMIDNPSPTRAEITDVANAVLDGTDAVMLSGRDLRRATPHQGGRGDEQDHRAGRGRVRLPRPPPDAESEVRATSCPTSFASARPASPRRSTPRRSAASPFPATRPSRSRATARPTRRSTFLRQPHILGTLNLLWGVRAFHYDKSRAPTARSRTRSISSRPKASSRRATTSSIPARCLSSAASRPIWSR